jgi:hypothetical protein
MIPRIAAGGGNFCGAFKYYLRDKNADTNTRVAWTHTENLLTRDPDKAWRVMAYTAKEHERLKEASGQKTTGRKLEKPVFAYSLSWHPEQKPDREHMLATAQRSLAVLGFTEHEAVIIAHRDEPQHHVHVVVNRVHPLTGLAARTGNSKLKLSDFARKYEAEHGKIYCQQRQDNHRQRQEGKRTMYRDPIIAAAWAQADNGRGFAAALAAHGYRLAQGRKRLVVLDPYGHAHNPVRHIEGIRTKDLDQKIGDLDRAALPEASAAAKVIVEQNRQRYEASLRHDEQAARDRRRLEERHRTARAELTYSLDARLARERVDHEQHHGLREQAQAIDQLRRRTQNPKWWQRLLGITRRDRQQLAALELTYQNAQWRVQECIGQLEAERATALARLDDRQREETRRFEHRQKTERPRDYVHEAERDKMRAAFEPVRDARTERGFDLER